MTGSAIQEWRWFRRQLQPFLPAQIRMLALVLGGSLLSLLDPLIIKRLIDQALPRRRMPEILIIVGVLLALYAGRLACQSVASMLNARVLQLLVLRLRMRFFRRLQTVHAGFYDSHPTGDLVFRLEQDVDQISRLGVEILPSLIRIVFLAVMVLGAMLWLNPGLGCIALAITPVFFVFRLWSRERLGAASESVRDVAAERSTLLTESLAAAVQIQLLGAERPIARRYGRLAARSVRAGMHQRRVEVAYSALSFAIVALTTGVILATGGMQVIGGSLTIGGYVAFYTYLSRLFDPIGNAVEIYAHFQRVGASIRRLVELDRLQPSAQAKPQVEKSTPAGFGELQFDRVAFSYSPAQSTLLEASFRLRRGERLALQGCSGSGKSTIAKLMARLYEPPEGCIRLDGRDIRELDLAGFRRNFAFVPQDCTLFQGTVRENLLLGNRSASEGNLRRAVRIACFQEVLDKLPSGLDQRLGPFGSGLSGGERQRLAVARALLQQRPVLVLDEATSALDALTEEQLLQALKDEEYDKTILIIGHRASYTNWADRMILVECGRVIEETNDATLNGAGDNGLGRTGEAAFAPGSNLSGH